jgi:hypothetical protein
MNPRLRVLLFLSAAVLILSGQDASAQLNAAPGDYPAFRGADRTGRSPRRGC